MVLPKYKEQTRFMGYSCHGLIENPLKMSSD